MREFVRRRRRALVVMGAAGLAAIVGSRLPLRSALLALGLKTRVDVTRGFLLLRLVHPATGQDLFLLGTTHHRLFFDGDYSLWHVKAALQCLDVDAALVEVLPEDLAAGREADGPVEMPFVIGVARARGLAVHGIDARWNDGWRARQDRMFASLQAAVVGVRAAVVVCGYLHLRAFREQLLGAGFRDASWGPADAEACFAGDVARTLPRGFRAAVQASLDRARQGRAGHEPFAGAGTDWFVDVRQRVLAAVATVAEDP